MTSRAMGGPLTPPVSWSIGGDCLPDYVADFSGDFSLG